MSDRQSYKPETIIVRVLFACLIVAMPASAGDPGRIQADEGGHLAISGNLSEEYARGFCDGMMSVPDRRSWATKAEWSLTIPYAGGEYVCK